MNIILSRATKATALYALVITALCIVAVLLDNAYSSGNHWFLFGTKIDRLLQNHQLLRLIIATPIVITAIWLARRQRGRDALCILALLALMLIAYQLLLHIALD